MAVVTAACPERKGKGLQHSHGKLKMWSQFPQPREQLASPSTTCGGYFSPSAVIRSIESSWDDRDLSFGKMGTVAEVQSVLSLAWVNMWDQTVGTLLRGLPLCLCGPW